MTSSEKPTASEEIAIAIAEAARDVSKSSSVQASTERLLTATLEALPPPHRIENAIEVILEGEGLSDKL